MYFCVSSAYGLNQVSLIDDDPDEASDESYTECDDDNCSAGSQESVVAPHIHQWIMMMMVMIIIVIRMMMMMMVWMV